MKIHLLGPLVVVRDGTPVALPSSRKTRALLAWLALTGRAHTRTRLVSLLWDVPDDPKAALRWSLSKLRGLVDGEERRLVTHGDTVALSLDGVEVDALEVRRAAADGFSEASTARLLELAALFRGPALEDLEQPDLFDYEAWRVAEQQELARLRIALLDALVARLDPTEAVPHARLLVRLEPESVERHACLVRLLREAGRPEEARKQIELSRHRLESVGRQAVRAFRSEVSDPTPPSAPTPSEPPHQEVRLCTAPDGTHLAWASLGRGPPVVKTANWLNHLEYDWKSPLWRHLARELASEHQLIRYDQRGTGLSDRDVEDLSLEAQLGDLDTVVEASGVDRFALLGISQGCRVAVAYAVRHPERVSHLVLYGGSARGWKHRSAEEQTARQGLQAMILSGWGRDTPAFRQVFTTLFMPDATVEQASAFNELQRVSTSPENAWRITEAGAAIDVTDLLPRVQAPTLVLHASRDAMVSMREGRRIAASIPGARFVALDSDNHLLLEHEPAFERFLSEVRGFLASD